MPDGRVAFIDFGMTKRVAREDIEAEVGALRAAMDGDAAELHRRLAAMGFFDPDDEQVTPEAVFEHFHDVTAWYIEDREVTVDRALVAQTLIDFGDPRSRHWQLMRRETMPPQAMLARRMEALTLGVLGQLEATANWHRIAREWLFGDPPSTELGALEEPFHTARLSAGQGHTQDRRAAPRRRPGHGPADRRARRDRQEGAEGGASAATPTARCCARSWASSSRPRRRGRSTGACSSCSTATRPRRSSCSRPTRTQIRAAGLSRPKISYLRDLAQHVEDGALELERLDELSDEEVIEQLTAVKGIGEWSAHMFLMFHLGRPDVLPVGDQGIRNAVKTQYRLRKVPDAKRLEKIAKPWRPYRTLACLYLWSSLDNTPG